MIQKKNQRVEWDKNTEGWNDFNESVICTNRGRR